MTSGLRIGYHTPKIVPKGIVIVIHLDLGFPLFLVFPDPIGRPVCKLSFAKTQNVNLKETNPVDNFIAGQNFVDFNRAWNLVRDQGSEL